MEPRLTALQKHLETAEAELPKSKTQVESASAAFREEETAALIADRAPSEKLRKKLIEATEKHDALNHKLATLNRSIGEIQEQNSREREQREYEAREAFKAKAAPVVKKLHQALFAGRNYFWELLQLMEAESITLPNLHEFIFPPADPTSPIDDMQLRFAKLSTLNGLSAWIREDITHSRFGPQQPQEAL